MKILSIKNIEDARFRFIPFDGEWYQAFGTPERSGCWMIYGKSGQGKTGFALQLARKFDEMGMRVLYISLEMGALHRDFQEALHQAGIRSGQSHIQVSEECRGLDDLEAEINKQRSADVVFIDSIQYFEKQCGVKAEEIISIRMRYPRKIFVFISHVEGREVEGKTAYEVKRDAFRRIYIEGFKASHIARGAGGPRGYLVIWEKGYEAYWLRRPEEENPSNNQPNEYNHGNNDE